MLLQRDIDRAFGSSVDGFPPGAFVGQVRAGVGRVPCRRLAHLSRPRALSEEGNPQESRTTPGRTSSGAGGENPLPVMRLIKGVSGWAERIRFSG